MLPPVYSTIVSPGEISPSVQVKLLRDAVLGLDVVAAEGLRAVYELDVLCLAHTRHRAQALQLVLEAVLALDAADEYPVLLAVVVRLAADRFIHELIPLM